MNFNSDFNIENQSFKYEYEFQEYYLVKDNIIYKITIERYNDEIFIKYRNYSISCNLKELSILFKKKFDNIIQAYEFINTIFDGNKAKIEKITQNKDMKIIFNIGKEFEVILLYEKYPEKESNNFILNEINQLKNDINELKLENNKIKEEIKILKKDNNSPSDIKLVSDVTNNSFTSINIDNTFAIFESINKILYLIYSTINKSIICYDINEQKIIKELNNYHNEYITNFRHYFEEKNKRDLMLSISQIDNNIILWNVDNWECLLNIPHSNDSGLIYSSCFIYDNNQSYIVTSNCNWDENSEFIKIYDFNQNKIKEIKDSNEITFFIDVFYDNLLSINYIITGNYNFIKSYNYNSNTIYHKYFDKNNNSDDNSHFIVITFKDNGILKLIESCNDGIIRIWNFHNGELISRIKINDGNIYGMCLWNNYNLFVGCNDRKIKLINLKNELIMKCLEGHNNDILTIKKIIHPKYGECLISQGLGNDQIKLWKNGN